MPTNHQEDGTPVDKEATEKTARLFVDELFWCMEAKTKMETAAY